MTVVIDFEKYRVSGEVVEFMPNNAETPIDPKARLVINEIKDCADPSSNADASTAEMLIRLAQNLQ